MQLLAGGYLNLPFLLIALEKDAGWTSYNCCYFMKINFFSHFSTTTWLS